MYKNVRRTCNVFEEFVEDFRVVFSKNNVSNSGDNLFSTPRGYLHIEIALLLSIARLKSLTFQSKAYS